MTTRRGLLLAGTLALGGCGLSERPYAEKRQWPLAAARNGALPPRPGGRILLVRDVQAAPGLDARGLQALQADGSVRTSFWEEWAVPPAEAVGSDLRQWLAQSGLFAAVVAPGSRLVPDLMLEATLTALLADAVAGKGRVTLAVVLIDGRGGATPILMQRRITAERPLDPAADPAQTVRVLLACLRDVLEQVETAVGAAMGRLARPPGSAGRHGRRRLHAGRV